MKKIIRMNGVGKRPIFFALLAALLYGFSAPFSKLLLQELSPYYMAAFLYLGAGAGMLLLQISKRKHTYYKKEAAVTKNELPYIIGMVILDIAAPIFFMIGISQSGAATAALLNNFEIVATTMLAWLLFHEAIGRQMWFSILLILLSTIILTFDVTSILVFNPGTVFLILGCICWGFENNCTRMISLKDPVQIVIIKGFGSGFGSLLIAFFVSETIHHPSAIFMALLLGFFSYGLSIYFYIKAQRILGAARTSAYYAAAPFIGVLLSFALLREELSFRFFPALILMIVGTYLSLIEVHKHQHLHPEEVHEHRHSHEDGHHMHEHELDNRTVHSHEDGHHTHNHGSSNRTVHSHVHTHAELKHTHEHMPDIHHHHSHKV